MVGGAFLCYEGVEKLAHRWLHRPEEDEAHHQAMLKAASEPGGDLKAVEQDRIKGAVRTDFILSAEIITITLGTVSGAPLTTQAAVLVVVAVAMTVGVYGLVAGIVKLDDLGLAMSRRDGAVGSVGRGIVRAAPWLMKALSVAGTAAMFLVGGGIVVHGLPALHHAVLRLTEPLGGAIGWLSEQLANVGVGLIVGAVVLATVAGVKRLRQVPVAA
jgi:predicted DNA repair protein MutK